MFSDPVSICLALTAVALVMHRVGFWATRRHTRDRAPAREAAVELPPLTLLKPIKGLEEELEQNLRSFFEQAYPAPLQLIFCSTEAGDPGIALARRIAAEYAGVDRREVRFVVSDPAFGANPKVANLAGALSAARHDIVLQSDANVRLRPGYLEAVVREFVASDASILGSLIAGRGERSLGAVLDNIQLTTFTTPGICLADEVAGIQCVIGKAMLFRRSELEALGGLALVKDVLAEDFVLGETYAAAGKRVLLSRWTVDNINVDAPLGRFAARHTRWLQMRVVLHLGGFIADLISNATFFAFVAWLLSGFTPSLLGLYAGVVAYKIWVDQRISERLRGQRFQAKHALAMPLRDLILPCLWLYALFVRTTEWRGQSFQLSRGSLLTPLTAAAPGAGPIEEKASEAPHLGP